MSEGPRQPPKHTVNILIQTEVKCLIKSLDYFPLPGPILVHFEYSSLEFLTCLYCT